MSVTVHFYFIFLIKWLDKFQLLHSDTLVAGRYKTSNGIVGRCRVLIFWFLGNILHIIYRAYHHTGLVLIIPNL